MRFLILLCLAGPALEAAELHRFEFPDGGTPPSLTVPIEEGNFRVTVQLGSKSVAAVTTIKAESRRLMIDGARTAAGQFTTHAFTVNVRNHRLPPVEKNAPGGKAVALNAREEGSFTWDYALTLEFTGAPAHVASVAIEPVDVPTLFLVGDSTVTDQRSPDGASWGQMLPVFFDSRVAVANHAESGETLKSFLAELRLAKVLSQMKRGDWLFIQFGHNDQKKNWPQTYAEAGTTFKAYLRAYIAEARLRGATPVLVTSPQRRSFDDAGRIRNTHGDYPKAVREVAAEENVALIDLEPMSRQFYERLGPERAATAFADGGRDATHHNELGAYELAKCVVQVIREAKLPLVDFLK